MTLIILLIVLVTERVALQSPQWYVPTYLVTYLKLALSRLSGKANDGLSLLLFVAAPALVLAVLLYLLDSSIINFFVSLLVLAVCIGNNKTRHYYRQYLNAASRHDEESKAILQAKMAMTVSSRQEVEPQHETAVEPESDLHERQVEQAQEQQQALPTMSEILIWDNFKYYAAPIFYFVLFGAPGVVFYATLLYLVEMLKLDSHEGLTLALSNQTKTLEKWLEWGFWLPSRLVSLGFMFVGHFSNGLEMWLRHAANFSIASKTMLCKVAKAAESEEHEDALKEAKQIVKLAKRNMVLFLVVVALLTLYGQII